MSIAEAHITGTEYEHLLDPEYSNQTKKSVREGWDMWEAITEKDKALSLQQRTQAKIDGLKKLKSIEAQAHPDQIKLYEMLIKMGPQEGGE